MARLLFSEARGTIVDLFDRFGGEQGDRWLDRVKALLHEGAFPTWKTIKLGLRKSADEYRQALKDSGNRISDWANDILGKPAFTVAAEEIEVDLVVASNTELGYPDGATVKQTCDRAKEFGLGLCPAEVGPALREQYQDQPKDDWFFIAMEPITDSDGNLRVFCVGHDDDGRWLDAIGGHPDNFWHGHSRWVFVRPRK